MRWILYLFSVAMLSAGCLIILYTADYRRWLRSLVETTPPRILAALPAGIGLLLILASFSSTYPALIVLLGLMALAKGALIFFNPGGILDSIQDWAFNAADDRTLRLLGIIAVVLGTAIFSWVG